LKLYCGSLVCFIIELCALCAVKMEMASFSEILVSVYQIERHQMSENSRFLTEYQRHIPDVVLIQLILLMMSTCVLETCREL